MKTNIIEVRRDGEVDVEYYQTQYAQYVRELRRARRNAFLLGMAKRAGKELLIMYAAFYDASNNGKTGTRQELKEQWGL